LAVPTISLAGPRIAIAPPFPSGVTVEAPFHRKAVAGASVAPQIEPVLELIESASAHGPGTAATTGVAAGAVQNNGSCIGPGFQ
jgi:hypothetical protein